VPQLPVRSAGTYCYESGINMLAKYVFSFAATKCGTSTQAVSETAMALAEGSAASFDRAVGVLLAVVIEGEAAQPAKSAAARAATAPVRFAAGNQSIVRMSSTPVGVGQPSDMERAASDPGYGIGATLGHEHPRFRNACIPAPGLLRNSGHRR
jgi:hypothetical protein